jgi:hypothetical protein
VKSLYYLSKIAENLQLQITIPPTILIGFGDETKLMYNELQHGYLIVKKGMISPTMMSEFVSNHMLSHQIEQSIED